ncbi:hypothetical protein VIBNISFn118_630005 [Vibrio nigripulchritudo SFn118]|nr:hypothetical protein VIBNISFn118_630005 [Vibrio nigripulchritudo SFn118]
MILSKKYATDFIFKFKIHECVTAVKIRIQPKYHIFLLINKRVKLLK